ncbi:hypothetical protein FALBO_11912 [Fusarium albosuccineum]|uniref:PD-(D/E)XK nuclease-like domain-containing protein n=1 Tax=Fusarium albosuccineum TaxID=1237068 RepID=A0A8H4PHJ8_9HYPO|nr:hypothetical protein FALBO_11912 [Fusarium albosuccineum]
MSARGVSTWLDTILSDRDPAEAGEGPDPKRRQLHAPTPESSVTRAVDDATPAASGAERLSELAEVADETSQTCPSIEREQTAPRESGSSPASHIQDDASCSSGTTCSGFSGYQEHDWYGVKEGELSELDPLPPVLETLLKQIQRFSDGVGILPYSARRRFSKLGDEDMEWAKGAKSSKHYSKEREALGEIPSPDNVRKIVAKHAEYCQFMTKSKKLRNISVNSRVLDLALERADGYLSLVNSLWISDVRMAFEYNKCNGYDKKVDFCFYVDLSPDTYEEIGHDINRLRRSPVDTTFNHTDSWYFSDNPLALSINTDGKRLDLGISEATRWKCLKDFLKGVKAHGAEELELSLPEFLPAILVDGEDWYVVITTHERKKTTVWHQIKIGSTSSVQGIYQIIAVLQLLRQWVEDIFWPWLKDVLEQSRPTPKRAPADPNRKSFN